MKKYKRRKVLKRKFGVNEYGFADLPTKISGVTISRFENDMGCEFCFPHGYENYNSTESKNYRDTNWKRYRPTQWKEPDEISAYGIRYLENGWKFQKNWEARSVRHNGYKNIWKRRKGKWKPR
jgi:hypothetical protein